MKRRPRGPRSGGRPKARSQMHHPAPDKRDARASVDRYAARIQRVIVRKATGSRADRLLRYLGYIRALA